MSEDRDSGPPKEDGPSALEAYEASKAGRKSAEDSEKREDDDAAQMKKSAKPTGPVFTPVLRKILNGVIKDVAVLEAKESPTSAEIEELKHKTAFRDALLEFEYAASQNVPEPQKGPLRMLGETIEKNVIFPLTDTGLHGSGPDNVSPYRAIKELAGFAFGTLAAFYTNAVGDTHEARKRDCENQKHYTYAEVLAAIERDKVFEARKKSAARRAPAPPRHDPKDDLIRDLRDQLKKGGVSNSREDEVSNLKPGITGAHKPVAPVPGRKN